MLFIVDSYYFLTFPLDLVKIIVICVAYLRCPLLSMLHIAKSNFAPSLSFTRTFRIRNQLVDIVLVFLFFYCRSHMFSDVFFVHPCIDIIQVTWIFFCFLVVLLFFKKKQKEPYEEKVSKKLTMKPHPQDIWIYFLFYGNSKVKSLIQF